MDVTGHPYPASLEVETPERMARWRPLVQWLLAIPHMLILYALGVLSWAVGIVSWFVVLITGRLPVSLAGAQAMYLRYANRTYAYAGFLVEPYPPFAFGTESADPADYPGVRTDVVPDFGDRNRLTVAFRLILLIPHIIVLYVLQFVAGIVWFISLFVVLFTGSWNDGMRNFVLGYMRWSLRVGAYGTLLNDEYPPFTLD